MRNISFKRHRFPSEFIRHAVWFYARFTLSYRDVEDLLAERGLEFLVQPKRNAKAALKLMRKLLKKQGWAATRIVTDKLRSYHVAFRTLELTADHIDDKRANNRAENSHHRCAGESANNSDSNPQAQRSAF